MSTKVKEHIIYDCLLMIDCLKEHFFVVAQKPVAQNHVKTFHSIQCEIKISCEPKLRNISVMIV